MKSKKRVYIASPYSIIGKPNTRENKELHKRWEKVTKFLSYCLAKHGGDHVFFGPITHSHPIALFMPNEYNTFEFWVLGQDEYHLIICDELWLYCDQDWDISKGVNHEIKIAHENNICIRFFDPETYKEWFPN